MNKKISAIPEEFSATYQQMDISQFHIDGSRIYIAPRKDTIIFLLKTIITALKEGTSLYYVDFNINSRYKEALIKRLKLIGYSDDKIESVLSHFKTNNLDHHGEENADNRTAGYAVCKYMVGNKEIPQNAKIIINHCDADSVLSAYLLDKWALLNEEDREFLLQTTEKCDYIANDSLEIEKRFFDNDSEDYPQYMLKTYVENFFLADTKNIRKLETFMKNALGLDNPISTLSRKAGKSNVWVKNLKKMYEYFEKQMQNYTAKQKTSSNILFLTRLSPDEDMDFHYSMIRKGHYLFGSFMTFNPIFDSVVFRNNSFVFEEKNKKIIIKMDSESAKKLMESIENRVDIEISSQSSNPEIDAEYKVIYRSNEKELEFINQMSEKKIMTTNVIPMFKYVALGYNGSIATLDIKELVKFIGIAEDRKRVIMLFEKHNIPKLNIKKIDAVIALIQAIKTGKLQDKDSITQVVENIELYYDKNNNKLIIKFGGKDIYKIPLVGEKFLPLNISESWQSNREGVGTGPFDGSVLSTEELNQVCGIFYNSKIQELKENTVSRFTNNIASKNDLLINDFLVPILKDLKGNEKYYKSILSKLFKNISIVDTTQPEILLFHENYDLNKLFNSLEKDSILSGFFEELKDSYQKKRNTDFKEDLLEKYANYLHYSEHLTKMGVPDISSLTQSIQSIQNDTDSNEDIVFILNDLVDIPNVELMVYLSAVDLKTKNSDNAFYLLYIAKQLTLKGYRILGFKTHIHTNEHKKYFDIISSKKDNIYITEFGYEKRYDTIDNYILHVFPEGIKKYTEETKEMFMEITREDASESFIHLIKCVGLANAYYIKSHIPDIKILGVFPNTLKVENPCNSEIKSLTIDKVLRRNYPETEYVIIDGEQTPISNGFKRNSNSQ